MSVKTLVQTPLPFSSTEFLPETRPHTPIPPCWGDHKQAPLAQVKIAASMARKTKTGRTRPRVSGAKRRGLSLATLAQRLRKKGMKDRARKDPSLPKPSECGAQKRVARKRRPATVTRRPVALASNGSDVRKIVAPKWRRSLLLAPVVTAAMLIMAPVVPRDRKPTRTIPIEVAEAALPHFLPTTLTSRPGLTARPSPFVVVPMSTAATAESPRPAQSSTTSHSSKKRHARSLRHHRRRYANRRRSKETSKQETPPCPS